MTQPNRLTPNLLEFRGLTVDLDRCTARARRQLQTFLSPSVAGAKNPLAELEILEERTLAEAASRLSAEMIAAGRDDNAIEDALVSQRGYLEEHFTQRKLIALYER
jgi:hypothetical protein